MTTDAATRDKKPPDSVSTAPHLIVEPAWTDPLTGAVYVHKDLERQVKPWEAEEHIPPVQAEETFGDVESWAEYVGRFSADGAPLLTWSTVQLRAVLDYHQGNRPARCQWVATHPFERSREWKAWMDVCTSGALPQRGAIERLENLTEDIVEPDGGAVMGLLRRLRANVSATAETTLLPDGGTTVSFRQEKRISAGDQDLALPPEITIAIPVLKGHIDDQGAPVRYKLTVRLRASVDDDARLVLRFSAPWADRVLEEVVSERVAQAKALVAGSVLRAAA